MSRWIHEKKTTIDDFFIGFRVLRRHNLPEGRPRRLLPIKSLAFSKLHKPPVCFSPKLLFTKLERRSCDMLELRGVARYFFCKENIGNSIKRIQQKQFRRKFFIRGNKQMSDGVIGPETRYKIPAGVQVFMKALN